MHKVDSIVFGNSAVFILFCTIIIGLIVNTPQLNYYRVVSHSLNDSLSKNHSCLPAVCVQ